MKGIFLLTPIIIAAVACGDMVGVEGLSDANERTTEVQEMVTIPIRLESAQSGLLLTAATAYSFSITGCLSGYTGSITQANVDGAEVPKDDRDCLAKLTQFTLGGITYTPSGGNPFTTWIDDDTAIFDDGGSETARLKIISQLASPITGTEQIVYQISELSTGTDKGVLGATIGASAKVQFAAVVEPSFSIKSVELKGSSGTEAGQFEFVMECTTTIGVTDICETVTLSDLDYKLVEDTYSGAISLGEADTLFGTNGTIVSLPADRVAPGNSGTTNGGFVTVILDGPDNMASAPNMMLVIRSIGGSYQYFNVDMNVSVSF